MTSDSSTSRSTPERRAGRLLLDRGRRALRRLLGMGRPTKRAIVASVDSLTCVFAVWLAFSLRLGYLQLLTAPILKVSAIALAAFLPIFFLSGVYSIIYRFHGLRSLMQLARATAILSVPMIVLFMVVGMYGVPRTIGVLFPVIFFLLVALSRMAARYLLVEIAGAERRGKAKRALIYGAGSAGRQLALSLGPESGVELVGYLDDDERLDRQRLDGVPIFDARALEDVVSGREVDWVFLALPNLSRSRRRAIVDRLQAAGVHVQTLPAIQEIVDGKVSFSDLREIRIEDLLGRDPVAPNELLLSRNITGKTVLVSGAGGSIGSELCRQIIECGPQRLVLFEMTEHALFQIDRELRARAPRRPVEIVPELGSATDPAALERLFTRWKPDTVYHAAAYKHVPLVEANPLAGLHNNVFGTLAIARAARNAGVARFILISTDKAVRPTNVMGASKRICELVLQALADSGGETVFTMVRFGNVLGSSGSVVPQFEQQIRRGGPVTLTHREVTRFFMTIPEAAQLVIQAGAMAQGGDVFVLDMGNPVKIHDLATTMIRLAGRAVRDAEHPDGDIEIVEIGLRPGEKLYEELLIGAAPQATQHAQIMRSAEYFLPEAELMPRLDDLRLAIARGDREAALAVMCALVPEYRPAGSGGGPNDSAIAPDAANG